MRKCVALSMVGLLTTSVSLAHAVDNEKLRAAVQLPGVTLTAFWGGFNELGEFVIAGEQGDHAAEIARLHKAMQGNTSDAERWQRLTLLYDAQGNQAQSDEAQRKAVALYRARLKANPHEAIALTHLGSTLDWKDQAAEAERLLRQATEEAPRQWECWTTLGDFLQSRAAIVLLGEKAAQYGPHQTFTRIMTHPPTPASAAQARKLLDEAHTCFDKGVALGKDQANAYFRRVAFRMMDGCLRAALDQLNGQPANPCQGCVSPDTAADLRQVARLRPDDYTARGSAALFAILSAAVHGEHPLLKPEDALKLLSPEDQRAVRADVERLKELSQNTDECVAAGSMQALGMLYMLGLRDPGRATSLYQKVVALQPHNGQAWEALQALLLDQKKGEELVAVSERRVKAKESARSRLLLAKAYAYRHRWDDAEKEVEAARKLDPKDFTVALAWAALRIRACHDPQSLDAAHTTLLKTRDLFPTNPSPQQNTDAHTLEAIYWALGGHTEEARKKLQRVLQVDPAHEMARQALQALDAEPVRKQ